jgi:hypothetical protein
MRQACFVIASICYSLWVSPGIAGLVCGVLIEAVSDGHSHESHIHASHGTEDPVDPVAHAHGDHDGPAAADTNDGKPDDCCLELFTGGAGAFTSLTKTAVLPEPLGARDLADTSVTALQQALARLGASRSSLAPGAGRFLRRPPPLYLLHSSFLI